jgi:Tol biopolymer transport system component
MTNLVPGLPPRIGVWLRDLNEAAPWLISTNGAGEPGPGLNDTAPVLSVDGTMVAWESPAEDLVPNDRNGASDIFLRDTTTGALQLVSGRHPDLPAATGLSLSTLGPQSLSASGHRIGFVTFDSNLGPNDHNFWRDAYVRDLSGGSNLLVSSMPASPGDRTAPLVPGTNQAVGIVLSADGGSAAWVAQEYFAYPYSYADTTLFWTGLTGRPSTILLTSAESLFPPTLAPDGRLVAFHSEDLLDRAVTNLNGSPDVFLRDMSGAAGPGLPLSRSPMAVSTLPGIASTGNGSSMNPVFSPDGAWLAFQSTADLLGPVVGRSTVFQLLARRLASTGSRLTNFPLLTPTRLISELTPRPTVFEDSHLQAANARFSADSHYLFFETNTNQIYRHDLLRDFEVTLTNGPEGAGFLNNYARLTNELVCTECANPSVSGDGRFVAYESRPGRGGVINVYLRDLQNGQTTLISAGLAGGAADGNSVSPLVTIDARYVVFSSLAGNLVANDTNQTADVFLWERLTGAICALSRNFLGTTTGNHASSRPVLSADGRTVAFQSFASDLVRGDYNETRDIFVVTLGGHDSDKDGMDDDWELAHFGTLSRDGTGDFDKDGASDLEEYRAGTNPAESASLLRMVQINTVGEGEPVVRTTALQWTAIPGRTYRVQTKMRWEEAWTDLPGDVVAGGLMASKVATAADHQARFYRVQLTP